MGGGGWSNPADSENISSFHKLKMNCNSYEVERKNIYLDITLRWKRKISSKIYVFNMFLFYSIINLG